MPDFKKRNIADYSSLSRAELDGMLEYGRNHRLANQYAGRRILVFPHFGIRKCGPLAAATAYACLRSGADRILAIGVLHGGARPELKAAAERIAKGTGPESEPLRGIHTPGESLCADEFSVMHFEFLLKGIAEAEGVRMPELIVRYPVLTCGEPATLPGIHELADIAADSIIVSTMDTVHHGIGYGTPEAEALQPEPEGLIMARKKTADLMDLLVQGDYREYEKAGRECKSDGLANGPVLRHILGGFRSEISDLAWEDMSKIYEAPSPTWVAGGLIEMTGDSKR